MMMPEGLPKSLLLNSKKLRNSEILDIVAYGSSVKGKFQPRDTDVMLIFINTPLRQRQDTAQQLKESTKEANLDIRTMNFAEFFDSGFLARQGILVEGISLLDGKPLAGKLGFKAAAIFTYNLKNLSHNEKTKFTYALIGRNSKGMVKLLGGNALGRGAVEIPIAHSIQFEEFLQRWKLNYKMKAALLANYE
jgi:predicted nucleotidyltransferase